MNRESDNVTELSEIDSQMLSSIPVMPFGVHAPVMSASFCEYICVWVHTHIYICVWRPEVNVGCFPAFFKRYDLPLGF